MANNNNTMTTDVKIAGNTLDELQRFKYLGAIISEEGPSTKCSPDSSRHSSIVKSENSQETPQYYSNIKESSDAFFRDINLPVCIRNLDTRRQPLTQNTSNGDEMIPKISQHIIYRARHK